MESEVFSNLGCSEHRHDAQVENPTADLMPQATAKTQELRTACKIAFRLCERMKLK